MPWRCIFDSSQTLRLPHVSNYSLYTKIDRSLTLRYHTFNELPSVISEVQLAAKSSWLTESGLRLNVEERPTSELPLHTPAQYLAEGWSGMRNGQSEQAAASFLAAVNANPFLQSAHYGLALAQHELGFEEQALAALHRALKLDPEYADAHALAGTILAKQGNHTAAILSFLTAIEHESASVLTRVQLSTLLLNVHRLDEAIIHARSAVELAPNDANVQTHLGHVLSVSGHNDLSGVAFKAAIAIDGRNAGARIGLANLLGKQGLTSQAVEQARLATQLQPNNSRSHATLGYLSALNGEATAAQEAYAVAVQLEPGNAEAYLGWVNVLEREGNFNEAARVLEEACRILPNHKQLQTKRSALLDRLRNPAGLNFVGILAIKSPSRGIDDSAICDTYSFILEHPDYQSIDNMLLRIEYSSEEFLKEVYERDRGLVFDTRKDAYRDWLEFGRPAGLTFSAGKNTLLKIILKVKDEPELIQLWIDYHASIVGLHNIIIMDCGSSDPSYIAILEKYRGLIIILNYREYYDSVSDTNRNASFYTMLSKNCRYLTVIDADEFLFGCVGDTISRQNVLKILYEGQEEIYAGTWFPNLVVPDSIEDSFKSNRPIKCLLESKHIGWGTFAGKSITLSTVAPKVRYVGHNLHVDAVISRLRPSSFGKIGIIHLTRLGKEINKSRAAKHLHSKGVIPASLSENQIDGWLKAKLESEELSAIVRHYANIYLGLEDNPAVSDRYFETNILYSACTEVNSIFSDVFKGFDFDQLLDQVVKNEVNRS